RRSGRRAACARALPPGSGSRRTRSDRNGTRLRASASWCPGASWSWQAPNLVCSRMMIHMERAVLVYTTYPSVVEAEQAGRAVVERRLAACVNILPGMISHYWWQGRVERGEEVVMIIKTRASLAESVREAVKKMHSYTTPAVLFLPLEGGDPNYLSWVMQETREIESEAKA